MWKIGDAPQPNSTIVLFLIRCLFIDHCTGILFIHQVGMNITFRLLSANDSDTSYIPCSLPEKKMFHKSVASVDCAWPYVLCCGLLACATQCVRPSTYIQIHTTQDDTQTNTIITYYILFSRIMLCCSSINLILFFFLNSCLFGPIHSPVWIELMTSHQFYIFYIYFIMCIYKFPIRLLA